ncbi:MAG: diguanylate cyclase, partial [Magnetospirillum sp.]
VSRSADHSARYGGEEFCIILPETDHHGATVLAERIRSIVAGLRIPHRASGAAEYVTVSLGVVTVTCLPRDSAKSLVAMADIQLYRAKKEGRNRVAAEDRCDPVVAL